ncbi:NUDIX hydrolase [Fervidibacillus halotolerans]|uniref:NUDIX domain-containing protein n=1 Tax=Fervidibacillus halotolerans TaxID=2980027 RepID=A0A9E8LY84_9BACI|nr:NUDIX domain-containing protein [Fervidibacillus halotolerans]WAA11953.1 NUDIX domain-containing protein [Fervidibacillus halotolerans]
MQKVANCIYLKDNHILLLQKPRRNWWTIPGGKMEVGETVIESVKREFFEETGIQIQWPILKGIYNFLIKRGDLTVKEWMMFTFLVKKGEGHEKQVTEEGILQWHSIDELNRLPMAEGDRYILEHALKDQGLAFGIFEYTEDEQLLSYRIDV